MVDPLPDQRPAPNVTAATSAGRWAASLSPLPVPLTVLVGRERELDTVREALGDQHARLLTLVGPGGVGKTRLAIAVAPIAREIGLVDEVAFVDLAPTADPALVLPAIARAVGLLELSADSLLDRLATALRGRRLLVILDNLEQVVVAGTVLADLLTRCPDLVLLVTSRVPLRVSGEREIPVPPLDVTAAVQLFTERARAARPTFTLTPEIETTIADVCRELDGLPLAIELAAARTKVLSPQALRARLERRLMLLTGGPTDAPERLRTLRGAIAWSYDLLTPEEQRLFRRLSIFVGGFSLEAAEVVCEGEARSDEGTGNGEQGTGATLASSPPARRPAFSPLELDILDGVSSLVEKSLLRAEPGDSERGGAGRFAMLVTMREFAREALADSDEAEAIGDAHAAWALAFAERSEIELIGPDRLQWLQEMDAEVPNLRAAFGWFLDHGRIDDALRLATVCWLFWMVRGRMIEGLTLMDRALGSGVTADPALRSRALGMAGFFATIYGDYSRIGQMEEGLALARAAGDPLGEALGLFARGDLASELEDTATAVPLLTRALDRFRSLHAWPLLAVTLMNLGSLARRRYDDDAAVRFFDEALAVSRTYGITFVGPVVLIQLARIARRQGDPARARALYEDGLDLATNWNSRFGIAGILLDGAALAVASGQWERAARLYGADEAIREAIGMLPMPSPTQASVTDSHRLVAAVRQTLGDDAFASAWAAGRALSLDEIVAEARLVGHGDVSPFLNHPPGAAPRENEILAKGGSAGRRRSQPDALSRRELEVLAGIVSGRTNYEIADELAISPRTVQVHVAAILSRLGVTNRVAAASVALRDDLLADL